MIAVECVPGYERANRKTSIVTLRSAPNSPRYFAFGHDLSGAASISNRTNGLSSEEARDSSASNASGDPTSPSARAAWPRTNGSASDSANASTGLYEVLGHPDTEFLRGMEALAAGDEAEFVRQFEDAIASGARHNHLLLQYYAQYLLDRGADWQRVNDAVNMWRANHQFSTETLSLSLSSGPRTRSDEVALRDALARIPWIADARLERSNEDGSERWRLLLSFRPGRTVDVRQAVAAVTLLSIPESQRSLFEVTCRTLQDCTATRIPGR